MAENAAKKQEWEQKQQAYEASGLTATIFPLYFRIPNLEHIPTAENMLLCYDCFTYIF